MSQWQTTVAVLAVLVWWMSPPASLGDLARREALRRQAASRSVRTLTNQDLPESPPLAMSSERSKSYAAAVDAVAPKPGQADRPDEPVTAAPRDEAWWRTRMEAARAAAERDRFLAEAVQSRINSLTSDVASRDDPAQRAVLTEQRLRALAELDRLHKALDDDVKAIEDISEEARKQGIPPGWIRGELTGT